MKVYLDNHSTTRPDMAVSNAMLDVYSNVYANASSSHEMGLDAFSMVEIARAQVANLLNVDTTQVYFTASASEANNIILKGKAQSEEYSIITTPTEHKSILNSLASLSKVRVHYLKMNKNGTIDFNDLEEKLKHKNILMVSIMTANNEIGTIHDINAISKMCGLKGVFFHTDATQALGKVKLDMEYIDALTCSGHKIHGPKGCGILYLKENNIKPLIDGGLQNTITSGTINTAAIVGTGVACSLLLSEQNEQDLRYIRKVRDMLLGGIISGLDDVYINGTMENRLVNNINISIKGVPSEVFMSLPDIFVSSGSACAAGSHEPSYVLKAIGAKYINNVIRFGLSKLNTEQEILYTIDRIIEIVQNIRYG